MKHVLIVGGGSVGKRHASNLAALGSRISCVDPRSDRREDVARAVNGAVTFADLSEAMDGGGPFDGMVVASPTSFHVDQAIAGLEFGLPILLEKPISIRLEDARRLERALGESPESVLMGYTWRWWPPLWRVRELLDNQTVGRIRHAQFFLSAHLADWHPWERYQDFFMASKELGGGALLDESHWLDLMVWLFGFPEKVFARIGKISDLEIETDDCVDMAVEYADGLRVTIHLDLFGRPHEKSIRFSGEKGSILWTAEPNAVAVAHGMEQEWETTTFDCERNDMFMGTAREFVEVMKGHPPQTCDLGDGIRAMEIIEAARRSNTEGQVVSLDGETSR